MTDLTKITTPFGLLDEATQEALKAHGGPFEWFSGEAWLDDHDVIHSFGTGHIAVRVKPQPPKPREWFDVCRVSNHTDGVYVLHRGDTKEAAESAAAKYEGETVIIRVREVLE